MFTKENIYATCLDAIKVSVVVGTILSVINQTEFILNFSFTKQAMLRIFLNFLVPFLVASYARYSLLYEQYNNENELDYNSEADLKHDHPTDNKAVDIKKNVRVG